MRDMTVFASTGAALAAAGAGAALFALAGLPMPALLGAITGAALLRLRAPVDISAPVRNAGLFAIGLQIGSTFTEESARRFAELPLAAVGLVAGTAATMAAGFLIYRRLAGWDRNASFLGAAPGAFSTVLALTLESKVDATRVILAQTFRLAALVFLFPLAFRTPETVILPPVWTPAHAVIVLAAGLVLGGVLHRARTPAAWMLGPSIAGAALTVSGLINGGPPLWVVTAGLMILGAATGARIAAAPMAAWRRDAGAAVLGFLAMSGVAGAAALATAWATGLPVPVALLAFAPGGFEAMIALAVALDLDPALVSAAHITRVIGLTVLLPVLHRAFGLNRG
ncbi:MAG: AbrB family transcriptional regulator [Caulobacterales bacterium]|nr:AbrB family transcriptional regulator [Caulobacterales bacterium]